MGSVGSTGKRSRSILVSPEELDTKVDAKVAEKLQEFQAEIAKREGAKIKEQLTQEWADKVDAQVDKAETLKLRATTAEKALKDTETELVTEKLRGDKLALDVSQREAQMASRDSSIEELREASRGDGLRIASLEAQLATQTGRAEALEQSYAAELDASAKAAGDSRQKVAGLNAELQECRREVEEEKRQREEAVKEAAIQEVSSKQGESSKILFTFVANRMKGAEASALAKWKLFVLFADQTSRRSNLEHEHAIALAAHEKESSAEIARLTAAATTQRLELETHIRQLQVSAEQMELALVHVAKPGPGSPVFDRGVALKRCNFG
jgi:hypothetical protein